MYSGDSAELLLQSEAALIILLYSVAEAAIIRLRKQQKSFSEICCEKSGAEAIKIQNANLRMLRKEEIKWATMRIATAVSLQVMTMD